MSYLMKCWPKGIKASANSHKHCPSSFHRQITLCCCFVQLTTFMNEKELSFSIQLMLMHKKLTLYTCFCTPRSQLSNCLQKPWRECSVSMGAQLSFGSAVAAGAAQKQDAKIRTGAQEGTSKGCFLEAVGKVRICKC